MAHELKLILPHGGYKKLRSFRCAQAVYDATVCERFVDKFSRTNDQMIQADRSGVQNIAEGSLASATSKKTEIKLTNVARASIEELLLDYQGFLRHRTLPIWDKDAPETVAVREQIYAGSPEQAVNAARTASAEVAANTILCLANQASFLLNRQIQTLEKQFLEQGGFTERMHSSRSAARAKSDRSDMSDNGPRCPKCGNAMVTRTAKQGANAGQTFWGCSGYPNCKGTRPA